MIIDSTELSAQALLSVVDNFILREGRIMELGNVLRKKTRGVITENKKWRCFHRF